MSSDVLIYNTDDALNNKVSEKPEIYNIVPETDPILQSRIPDFIFDGSFDAKKISNNLIETVKQFNGYGLSANQCGLNHRFFVMGNGGEYVSIFNPEIVNQSEEESHGIEGCISFPGLVLGITRPKSVEVKYCNYNGDIIHDKFDGLTAKIFQHELDHLNGIRYTSRAKPLALKLGNTKREKYFRRVSRYVSNQKIKTK